jgi:hypothetical protein
MPQESVMKCANPTCNHSIGLVSHRRGFFGKQRYCSKPCRDHLAVALPRSAKSERATTYFEWLFMQPVNLQPRMAAVRVRAR